MEKMVIKNTRILKSLYPPLSRGHVCHFEPYMRHDENVFEEDNLSI